MEIKAPEGYEVKRGQVDSSHLPVVVLPHFDLAPIDQTKTRLNAVVSRSSARDVTRSSTPATRARGELIFRLIEQYAGGAPLGNPKVSGCGAVMTPQAIREGFDNLRSDQQMAGPPATPRAAGRNRLAGGINGNARDDGLQLARRAAFSHDHRGPVQTPDAVDRSNARKKSATFGARLLGDQGHLRRPGRASTRASGSTPKKKKP